MSSLVVDCSLAAAWCFEDEATAAADKLLARVRDHGGVVPALWHWEVSNVFATAVRRRRIMPGDSAAMLSFLSALPISTDSEGVARAWRETQSLAQIHDLTAYDAAYLELAMRTGLDLATLDADLRRVAKAVGVRAVP